MSFVAGILTLVGVYLVGDKNKYGFIIALASNIVWIAYSMSTGEAPGVILECAPLTVINARNFYKWHKEEKKKK